MDQQARHTSADLEGVAFDSPRKYEFYCALSSILGTLGHQVDEAPLSRQHVEGLTLRSNASLGHPQSEIEDILVQHAGGETWIEVEGNFFGLNGAASPLPSYLTEAILDSRQSDGALHEFTDFFNNRLLWMLFLAMRKYRYESRYVPGGDDLFSDWMFSFFGVVDREARTKRKLPWVKILSLLGLVAMPSRSAGMIAATVSHCFGIEHVSVQEFEEFSVEIPDSQRYYLGRRNTTLGTDTVLGKRVLSYDTKVVLVFSNLSFPLYRALLPNGDLHAQVLELLNLLLHGSFAVDYILGLHKENVPCLALGDEQSARLGWSSFLGGAGMKNRREARIKARG